MTLAQIQLTSIDYIAIGLYAVTVIFLGVRFRSDQKSTEDYLLAGRSMGWFVVAVSQLASLLSAITYLGTPSEAYKNGTQYLCYMIVGYLSLPIAIFLFLNFFYRLGIVSSFQYLRIRFNEATQRLASVFFIMLRVAWMATIVNATSIAVNKLTGLGVVQCIIVTAVLSTAYTFLGGMRAIIWTDVLQFFLFAGGLIGAIVVLGLTESPRQLYEIAVEHQKFSWPDVTFDPTVRVSLWAVVFAAPITGLALVTDQVGMQRYLSAKSLREAQKALWSKPLLTIPLPIMLFAIGLGLFGHYQLHPELASFESSDEVFPYFILTELPAGLSGVIIAAVFAAAMSSIDSGIHTLSTVSIEDFYKGLRPEASDATCLALSRWLILFWGAVTVGVGLAVRHLGTIIEMMGQLTMPFFGCMVGLFLLGTATRRATSLGALVGGVCGLVTVMWVVFFVRRFEGEWYLFSKMNELGAQKVSFTWYPAISFVGTFVVGYLVSRLGPPPNPERLHGLTIWTSANKKGATSE